MNSMLPPGFILRPPVMAEAQGVAERGSKSFGATFNRVLPMELGK